MESLHRILGYVAVAAVVAGIGWSVAVVRNPAFGGQRFARFQALVVALLLVSSIAGIGILISGTQPSESLHLVYAAIAIALLPLARSFIPETDRRRSIAALAAFVVLGFVLYRLFATG
jgi:hypothetical protein